MITTHAGTCFCGAVTLEVSGTPEVMGYCHCASCRSWSAGPVNAFTLWKPDGVEIRNGIEHVGRFQRSENVNYAGTVLRMKDGLPKFKDFPAELGGTGATLPE